MDFFEYAGTGISEHSPTSALVYSQQWRTANTRQDNFNESSKETEIGANGIQFGPKGNLYITQIFEVEIKSDVQANTEDLYGGTTYSRETPGFKASWQLLGPHSHPYLYGARGNNRWYGLRKSSLSGLPLERWGVAQNLFN